MRQLSTVAEKTGKFSLLWKGKKHQDGGISGKGSLCPWPPAARGRLISREQTTCLAVLVIYVVSAKAWDYQQIYFAGSRSIWFFGEDWIQIQTVPLSLVGDDSGVFSPHIQRPVLQIYSGNSAGTLIPIYHVSTRGLNNLLLTDHDYPSDFLATCQ